MITRKFKIICDGHFIGFIFVSENHPNFPNCKVATIWPFNSQGNWTNQDLELVAQRSITDIYEIHITDLEIQNILIEIVNIKKSECIEFKIISY
jgi:hypothetical protein